MPTPPSIKLEDFQRKVTPLLEAIERRQERKLYAARFLWFGIGMLTTVITLFILFLKWGVA